MAFPQILQVYCFLVLAEVDATGVVDIGAAGAVALLVEAAVVDGVVGAGVAAVFFRCLHIVVQESGASTVQ